MGAVNVEIQLPTKIEDAIREMLIQQVHDSRVMDECLRNMAIRDGKLVTHYDHVGPPSVVSGNIPLPPERGQVSLNFTIKHRFGNSRLALTSDFFLAYKTYDPLFSKHTYNKCPALCLHILGLLSEQNQAMTAPQIWLDGTLGLTTRRDKKYTISAVSSLRYWGLIQKADVVSGKITYWALSENGLYVLNEAKRVYGCLSREVEQKRPTTPPSAASYLKTPTGYTIRKGSLPRILLYTKTGDIRNFELLPNVFDLLREIHFGTGTPWPRPTDPRVLQLLQVGLVRLGSAGTLRSLHGLEPFLS